MQQPVDNLRVGATIVTGGAAGIGRAITHRFAAAGEPVLIFDHDSDAAGRCVAELRNAGHRAATYIGSVADEVDVANAFQCAVDQFGAVRNVVNNAGVSCNSATVELSLDEWRQALDVNLTGVFLCSKEAARRMNNGGAIINMSSMYGVVAAPNRLGYCATKSAVAMMTKSLALEWAKQDIRVNALAPGYIRTALLEELIQDKRVDLDALERRTPQGRLGTPDEVADLAYFLISNEASYITGQVIGIDGGWSANGYL